VNSIGIVFEDDDEFGRLDACLISADVADADRDMESDRFDNLDLSHLYLPQNSTSYKQLTAEI